MLTIERIKELASKRGVKTIAVENFLMSAPEDIGYMGNCMNLSLDAQLYKWNSATVEAIRKGLKIKFGMIK